MELKNSYFILEKASNLGDISDTASDANSDKLKNKRVIKNLDKFKIIVNKVIATGILKHVQGLQEK